MEVEDIYNDHHQKILSISIILYVGIFIGYNVMTYFADIGESSEFFLQMLILSLLLLIFMIYFAIQGLMKKDKYQLLAFLMVSSFTSIFTIIKLAIYVQDAFLKNKKENKDFEIIFGIIFIIIVFLNQIQFFFYSRIIEKEFKWLIYDRIGPQDDQVRQQYKYYLKIQMILTLNLLVDYFYFATYSFILTKLFQQWYEILFEIFMLLLCTISIIQIKLKLIQESKNNQKIYQIINICVKLYFFYLSYYGFKYDQNDLFEGEFIYVEVYLAASGIFIILLAVISLIIIILIYYYCSKFQLFFGLGLKNVLLPKQKSLQQSISSSREVSILGDKE